MEITPAQNVKIDNSWLHHIGPEFQKDYMVNLRQFLKQEYSNGKIIYPKGSEYFQALNATPFDQVRVVILGQDPYHGEGQAHGLCFSVKEGVALPPSLLNIFKELKNDLGYEIPKSGHLDSWANQGVLLLNAVLTVESGQPASHQGQGWERFTDEIIRSLNREKKNLVFVLWGSYAQKKGAIIDRNKHFVIESVHPSPLSAHRGFFGSRPFSKINSYLQQKGMTPIDWKLNSVTGGDK